MCRAIHLGILSLFLTGVSTVSGAEEARTFTSDNGTKMEGSLLKSDGKSVTIIRSSDSRQITVPLARLSADDQKVVKEWLSAPERQRVKISARKERTARDYKKNASQTSGTDALGTATASTSASSDGTEVWQWVITVRNETAFPLEGAEVRYTQQVGVRDSGGSGRKDGPRSTGTLSLPVIPPFGSFSVKTSEMTVRNSKSVYQLSTEGGTYSDIRKHSESLDGVEAVLHYRGQVLKEFSLGSGGR